MVSSFSLKLPVWMYFNFWTHAACLKALLLLSFRPPSFSVFYGGSKLVSSVTLGSWSGIFMDSIPQIYSFIQAWAVGATLFCLSLLSHAVGRAGVPSSPIRCHFGLCSSVGFGGKLPLLLSMIVNFKDYSFK